jgi:dihydrodipicolinate synthase/N-acetylneuraminate lyase
MPKPQPVFTGVAVALVTFFDEHGQVDSATTARHALHLVERGVKAVVVAGSTGEASHLSMKERLSCSMWSARPFRPTCQSSRHQRPRPE